MSTILPPMTADPRTTFDEFVRAVAHIEPVHVLGGGDVLDGTYELVDRIGDGGMGVVFRARDRRLGRDVAVKVLRGASGSDADPRRLFEREARATAQLLHPNIVTLHHVGEHAGQPYLVLELLLGETLAARLSRRVRLPTHEALVIADSVLSAIAFAHQRRVLHRDLKPSNVFITSDDRIKVLDFGIALSLDTEPGESTRAAGTPGYMAPEQRDGGTLDTRTDVWLAARLIVECLTGRTEQVELDLLRELPLDRRAKAALTRALDSDPERRPGTAEELRAMLLPPTGLPRRAPMIALAAVALGATAAATVAIATRRPGIPSIGAVELEHVGFNTDMGAMAFSIDPDGTTYGVYERSEGILVGRFADGVFSGRWCERPTRLPPLEAGFATLRFARGGKRLLVEGDWVIGNNPDAPWHASLVAAQAGAPPDAKLVARLSRRESCP